MHYEQLYTSCINLATCVGDVLLHFHARRFAGRGPASRVLRPWQSLKRVEGV